MGTRGWLMFKLVQDLGLMFHMKNRAARRYPPWYQYCILAHTGRAEQAGKVRCSMLLAWRDATGWQP